MHQKTPHRIIGPKSVEHGQLSDVSKIYTPNVKNEEMAAAKYKHRTCGQGVGNPHIHTKRMINPIISLLSRTAQRHAGGSNQRGSQPHQAFLRLYQGMQKGQARGLNSTQAHLLQCKSKVKSRVVD